MSREHVLPEWLSLIGADVGGNYHMERAGGEVTRTNLIDVVTKRVCEPCNTGWLSRVESGAKEVLAPLLDASKTRITEVDRWQIARWFTKTTLTFLLARTRRNEWAIPESEYRNFYSNAEPARNLLLFLSGYQGPLLPIEFSVHLPEGSSGGRVYFHFHRVILYAFVVDIGKPVTFHIPNWHQDGGAHIIWPRDRHVLWASDPTLDLSWPPKYVLDESSAAILRDSLATFVQ